MKLEQQVISLPIAKRLKELRVKQEGSVLYWGFQPTLGGYNLIHDYAVLKEAVGKKDSDVYSAFTVAELGKMLPKWYSSHLDVKSGEGNEGIGDVWICTPPDDLVEKGIEFHGAGTEADARGNMLIYLLEQGLIKLEK